MNDSRPNPDKLLKAVTPSTEATLKVFFGYAAGVGKSYAMLKAAHELKSQGADIVVGYLEAHGRPETEILLEGLETIPVRRVPYGNVTLPEFDLDAALKRHPQVLIVDELPHTNAPGCRHTKRWQDVEELLRAGIAVYTTMNVQHLASLEDIVAQITGVQVRETVPDLIFDKASEVTLVDISPDDLLLRFKAGKIYHDAQAERALGNYFKKANLVALREIALRRTAERVHFDVALERTTANAEAIWPTSDRLLCAVGPDSGSANAIRSTARLAGAIQAPWEAIVVEAPQILWRSPKAEKRLKANLDLVESLGGKITHSSATFPALEVLRYARENNITKVIINHPAGVSPTEWVEKLFYIFGAVSMDVLWIHPLHQSVLEPLAEEPENLLHKTFPWNAYLGATGYVFVAFCLSAALAFFFRAPEANVALLYLLAVIVAAVVHGKGASTWAALMAAFLLSFGLSNFSWRLSWNNIQYLLSFALTLGMGLMAAFATSRLKQQAELARGARRSAEDLYEFSIALSETGGLHQIIGTAEKRLSEIFARPFVVLLKSANGYRPISGGATAVHTSPNEWAVANYVAGCGQPAGVGTQTLPKSRAYYLPLAGSDGVAGVLAIVDDTPLALADKTFVEKFAHTLAVRLETALVSEDAQKIYWQAEKDRLRGDLLSAVSQSLKAPLATLADASTRLSDPRLSLEKDETNSLLDLIHGESVRLERVVDNLTQITRFENGKLPINRQRLDLNAFIKTESAKALPRGNTHEIIFHAATPILMAEVDPLLLRQVLFNLIDNAAKYTPAASPIEITAERLDRALELTITDQGDGLPETELEKVFEKYYRLNSRTQGAGLGLTVCRAIVEAHGGKIWAENLSPKGLKLTVRLPQEA